MKYKIWNGKDLIYLPSGNVETNEETKNNNKWVNIPNSKAIICDAVINGGVFLEFYSTKEMFKNMGAKITDGMSDDEVLRAIEDFQNTPPTHEPSAEERIASAMEFQNLMSV